MSERLSDEEFTARLDKDLCGRGEHWCAAEARRARYEEERLRGELARERSAWDSLLEETCRLREKLERVAANRGELVEAVVASAVAELERENDRLREALKPFAANVHLLASYTGADPDRLVQMGITAYDCKRAAEVLKGGGDE